MDGQLQLKMLQTHTSVTYLVFQLFQVYMFVCIDVHPSCANAIEINVGSSSTKVSAFISCLDVHP